MAFTDQILNSILQDKQRILQKSQDLIRDKITDRIPLVSRLGESTLTAGALDISQIETIKQSLKSELPLLCPTSSEAQNIVNIKRSLQDKFLQVSKKTSNARKIARSLSSALTAISTTITILKTLPIPNSFTTAGLILTLGDLLDTIKILLDRFKAQVSGLEYVANSTDEVILRLTQQLLLIDNILAICVYSDIEDNLAIDPDLQSLLKDLNQNIYKQTTQETYKNYLIKIENDSKAPPVAPRHYAIIISPLGAIVYKGSPSFSSSTQVLIDEAKFYIDQLEN